MSGICSRHQGHDPNCALCTAVPLTEHDKAYYKGWDESREALIRNCWTPVENCVLNVYTKLEDAARSGNPAELKAVLAEIDKLRELHRGMWKRNLRQ